jgi:hypothetical protein
MIRWKAVRARPLSQATQLTAGEAARTLVTALQAVPGVRQAPGRGGHGASGATTPSR